MIKRHSFSVHFFSISLLLFCNACQSQVAIEDITTPPVVTESDKKYANVYKLLDGEWQGIFYIYEDSISERSGRSQPKDLVERDRDKMPLRLLQKIDVNQVYTSESPYFQRVKITDVYTNESGEQKIVESQGVNKIQNGQMWCIVVKPDETVIHSGETDGDDTIIWQRNVAAPLKIERFRETVTDSAYTIWGWGYYGEDDPNLSPKLWFWGDYKRVR